ncbi:MFS transporter [Acetanaerobacterium elongatum]|uniref:Predicted arabinose efflux permease, MFS family n=1 Tax=Acetanaerobacterium elongatum TaxID=258515 RepID=A0A1H0CG41_9FIRM|nr:MFS transporter [Acetanaerobacterium elongatum]SDN56806.1 Predicted arabinose efflux permease, MFS family [Acetanaerobacterium elongatum]
MRKLNFLKVYSGLPKDIYILFIAKMITCMGMFIMPLWTLILTQKIGLTKSQAGLMTTIFAVAQAPGLLLGGKLIDKVGRKRVVFFSQTFGAIIYIICAVVPMSMTTVVMLIAASTLYTVASPALDALTADITTPENRKASFSLIYFGINLGYTISPMLGGFLFARHLPLLFVLDAVTTIISTSLIMIYIKEPRFKNPDNTLSESAQDDGREASVLQVLWRTRILLYFILTMFIYQFCYTQWSFMLPLQMGDFFGGNGALNYSFLVTVNAITVIALTPIATALTQKFYPLVIMAFGGFCYFISFVMFGFFKDLPLFIIATLILTLGEILISVNSSSFIANQTPDTHRGRVNSLSTFMQGTCFAVAPLIMGNVISITNYQTSWWIIAGLMLLGFLSMLALNRKNRRI